MNKSFDICCTSHHRFITSLGTMSLFKKSHFASNIFIEDVYHRPSFLNEVAFSLSKISQTSSGSYLFSIINRYSNSGKKILISYTSESSQTSALLTEEQREKLKPKSLDDEKLLARSLVVKPYIIRNVGASADILFNPDKTFYLDAQGRPSIDAHGDKSWLILAHELIHAMRMLKGTSTAYLGNVNDPKSGARREELRAIGFGKKNYPSENSIRKELGEFLRKE